MLLYEPYELVPLLLVELEIVLVVVGFGETIGVELDTTLEDRALGIKADDWVVLAELMTAIDVGTETDIETDMSNDKETVAVGMIVKSLTLVVAEASAVEEIGPGDGIGISFVEEVDGTAAEGVSTGTETLVEGWLEAESDTDVGRAAAVSGGASTARATVGGAAV